MLGRYRKVMPEALTVFLWVASICAVLLTVLGIAVATLLILAALEARNLVRRVQAELEWWQSGRRELWHKTRFAGKWLRIMGTRIMR